MKKQSSLIGQSVPRVDAYDKVTGRAKFTADRFPKNCLVAKVLHATIANGLVKQIDTAKASTLPGVVKIVTCFDVPDLPFATSGNPWTLDPAWQDIADRKLLNQRVRYYGDDIAAVVAIDEATARQALRLIQVEYEEYPAVFTPKEAMQPGAVPVHTECTDNILGSNRRANGDYDAAIQEPGLICIDKWYHVPPVKHCHMENPVSYAYMEHQKVIVVASTQMAHVLRRVIAQALGLPWGQVQVIKPWVGGGFGNKDDALYEPLNAYLCTQVGGRCVRLELTREEDFCCTRTRHGLSFHLVTHVRRDGTMAARKLESLSNQGAYASHGHAIASKGLLDFSMLYRSDAYTCTARTVYTNTPCAGAMRGYGIPQITFALEAHIDDVAASIQMDPVAFRRKNMMAVGAASDDGALVNHFDSLNQCLDKAQTYLHQRQLVRQAQAFPPYIRTGTGCAIFWYKTGVWPICLESVTIRLLLNQDGTFLMHMAECEIGQGADTAFTQMAASRLQVPLAQVRYVSIQDTAVTPFGTGAYASRQTYVCGKAIAAAADQMIDKILDRAAEMTGRDVQALVYQEGAVYSKTDPAPLLHLDELAMDACYSMEHAAQLIVEITERCDSNALSLGCCFAEVAVDSRLGTIQVLDIVNAHDCGTLINPQLAAAQVHGGVSMGLGYGLTEQLLLDQTTGRMLNDNLLDYKLLTAMDHPDRIGAVFIENAEPTSPFGTKALGEPPAVPVAPAIRNAVLAATGAAIDTLPLHPAACLAAMQAAHFAGGDT